MVHHHREKRESRRFHAKDPVPQPRAPAPAGTRREPHSFAAASATRSHRSNRFRASAGSMRGIVRDDRNGTTRETPSSVAFPGMKSILSAFGRPTRRGTATPGGGAGGDAPRMSAPRG